MTLPNEILQEIFALFDPSCTDNPVGNVRTIFKIRTVCRRFRTITNEMRFWCDDNFPLVKIVPDGSFHRETSRDRIQNLFFKTFLKDQGLVQCLGKRSTWHFQNLATLCTIMELVPTFNTHTTSIKLFSKDDWLTDRLNIAITHLAGCTGLASLELIGLEDHLRVNLNLIVDSCPSICTIRLVLVDDICGTLAGLSNVMQLEVYESFTTVGILPTKSAKTLTRLSLIYCSKFIAEELFSERHIDRFVHLKSLHVSPLSKGVYGFLIRTNIRFTDFGTVVRRRYSFSSSEIGSLLQAQSLRNLQQLIVFFDRKEDWQGYFPPILDNIASKLVLLQYLVLGMAMNPSWNTYFPRLKNLKDLAWYVPQDDYADSFTTFDQHPADDFPNLSLLSMTAKKGLADVFQDFYEVPTINVDVMLNNSYDAFVKNDAALKLLFGCGDQKV